MSAAMEDLAVHRLADNRRAAVADSVARSFHTA
jgi:hypothetical protein